MTLVVILVGLTVLAIPALGAEAMAPRFAPDHSARLTAAALVAGAVAVWTGVSLHVVATLALLAGARATADAGGSTVSHLSPGGTTLGFAAMTVTVLLAWRVGQAVVRLRRSNRSAHADVWLGEHGSLRGHHLVVLPTPDAVAFAVASRPSQIVVSAGLLERLDADQLGVVLRHEDAHLRHRHDLFLAVATIVEHSYAWAPFVARSCETLRTALERWADESAASDAADRRLLDEALTLMAPRGSGSVDARRRAIRRPPASTALAPALVATAVLVMATAPGLAALGHWFTDASALVAAFSHP